MNLALEAFDCLSKTFICRVILVPLDILVLPMVKVLGKFVKTGQFLLELFDAFVTFVNVLVKVHWLPTWFPPFLFLADHFFGSSLHNGCLSRGC